MLCSVAGEEIQVSMKIDSLNSAGLPWWLMAQTVKNLPAMWETWIRFLSWEDLLKKGTATHSSILLGKFHGQRSLVGYSPWGCKE